MKIVGDFAYVADRLEGLIIFDLTNPTAPAELGSVDTPTQAQSVSVSGNWAFVASA